jgi:hypothetical protein
MLSNIISKYVRETRQIGGRACLWPPGIIAMTPIQGLVGMSHVTVCSNRLGLFVFPFVVILLHLCKCDRFYHPLSVFRFIFIFIFSLFYFVWLRLICILKLYIPDPRTYNILPLLCFLKKTIPETTTIDQSHLKSLLLDYWLLATGSGMGQTTGSWYRI